MPKSKSSLSEETTYVSKKCPHCFVYMPLNVLACPACKEKVGPVDKYGMASKIPDYRSYLVSIAAFVALLIFLYYAFIKDG